MAGNNGKPTGGSSAGAILLFAAVVILAIWAAARVGEAMKDKLDGNTTPTPYPSISTTVSFLPKK